MRDEEMGVSQEQQKGVVGKNNISNPASTSSNPTATSTLAESAIPEVDFSSIRGKIRENYNLSHLTWFKVGGEADIFFNPKDIDDLVAFLKILDGNVPVTILGAGSNIMIRDGGVEGAVIKLGQGFADITFDKKRNIVVGAGCLNFNLAKFAEASSIEGLEFLVGIPGTIGGGIAMNAGAYEREFKDVIISVQAVDFFGNRFEFINEDIGFSYRNNSLPDNLIFVTATIAAPVGYGYDITKKMKQISAKREETQPIREKTGGSTFANPEGYKAWQLIDQVGLRGKRIGEAGISEKHCNFMINHSNATAKDMEDLGEFVRSKVKEKTDIDLHWEIKRIGREY